MRTFTAWIVVAAVAVAGLGGCTREPGPDPMLPTVSPTRKIDGSTLPEKVAGYTALGGAPAAKQTTATYASDTEPLDLVVVTLDPNSDLAGAELMSSHWYGVTRCGVLWTGDPKATPQPQQSACITFLTDGIMTSVSGGQQTPEQLAQLANAINDELEKV